MFHVTFDYARPGTAPNTLFFQKYQLRTTLISVKPYHKLVVTKVD